MVLKHIRVRKEKGREKLGDIERDRGEEEREKDGEREIERERERERKLNDDKREKYREVTG